MWNGLPWGGVRRPRASAVVWSVLLVFGLVRMGQGTWHVKELARVGRGIYGELGYVVPFAEEADSLPLLVLSAGVAGSWFGLHFYRYAPVNQYVLVKVDTGNLGGSGGLRPGNLMPWVAGDLDGDSRPELIGYNANYTVGYGLVAAYVPPAGSGIPDSLRAGARYDGLAGGGIGYHLTDLDRDGRDEVSFFGTEYDVSVFEWNGDSLSHVISVPCLNGSDIAVGDFDQDGLTEVGTTGLRWDNWIVVYKCTGDNTLVPWDSTSITRPNGRVFMASNLDGSHRPVLFVSYFVVGGWAWLYEVEPTNGTRGYQPIPVDSIMDRGEVYAHSTCGDIDGDGLDEVLWSTGNQIRVYKCTGPHQYELVWVWDQGSNNSCNLNLYDMNGNGYNEIL